MKSMLDSAVRQEIISRIQQLTPNSRPLWGKMTVDQMLEHCKRAEESFHGLHPIKRSLLGRIIGPMAFRAILKNDKPLRRNSPSHRFFTDLPPADIESARQAWIRAIQQYDHFSIPVVTHWFFGDMTPEQTGQFSYKHADHHLRQFGV